MANRADLRKISRSRIDEAEILFKSRRYDAAVYLAGYAIEAALKARICATLKWSDYFHSGKYSNFGTHGLDVLLSLSGRAQKIRSQHVNDWSTALDWSPECRYDPIGSVTQHEAHGLIQSAKALAKAI